MSDSSIHRQAQSQLLALSRAFPVVALTGPRQSGKTTLAKACFPGKPYVSLESPDQRTFAQDDPQRFLAQFGEGGAVLDEIQRVPQLLSYLQTRVDATARMGEFVITGSAQFDLLAGISQSLAGRVGRIELLPLSWAEIAAHSAASQVCGNQLEQALWRGGYPALYARAELTPLQWAANYAATYVERDARQLINVRDLSLFQRFISLCAARSGQVLNAASLGADAGVTAQTVRHWLSVLEASYLVKLVPPYHNNFGKRITKAPKLYFCDTGLLCYLLHIHAPEQLLTHASRGAIFETWVMSELLKTRLNQGLHGLAAQVYYWRAAAENEIDFLLDGPQGIELLEVKSGTTIASDWFKALQRFPSTATVHRRSLVYAGTEQYQRQDVQVLNWQGLADWGA
jgi:uncharacterized protein